MTAKKEQSQLRLPDLRTDEENGTNKLRPADIELDIRQMKQRKRVQVVMNSKHFRKELEDLVDSRHQSSNISGPSVPVSNNVLPINDIIGARSTSYSKEEKVLRCKLAATFRLLGLNNWTKDLGAQITVRLEVDGEYFLVNPYGLLYNEITASSLNKVDMEGRIVEQGITNFNINKHHFALHSVVYAARPDIRCVIYIDCNPVAVISSLKTGLLPITTDACVLGEIIAYNYSEYMFDQAEERSKLIRSLGPNAKVILLNNHGALCCGETIEEAYFTVCHMVRACEVQLKLLPIDVDKLIFIPEDARKRIYDQARQLPEYLAKQNTNYPTTKAKADTEDIEISATKLDGETALHPTYGKHIGCAEFEALMRILDKAGFRTGYKYRYALDKAEPLKMKNDVELPPIVSTSGCVRKEEQSQNVFRSGDLKKKRTRCHWLNITTA